MIVHTNNSNYQLRAVTEMFFHKNTSFHSFLTISFPFMHTLFMFITTYDTFCFTHLHSVVVNTSSCETADPRPYPGLDNGRIAHRSFLLPFRLGTNW